jgi:hypothetical protein
MMTIRVLCLCLLTFAIAGPMAQTATAEDANALRDSFADPPEAAWPRTWWHWTRGAVSKRGITQDLEWMQRVGIGGFQLADVNFGGGQTVEPTVDFGSPEWLDAVRHAAAEADRLGLEMALFSSPGWSMTGGPWVKPEQAMKKLVWSETQVEGPLAASVAPPEPPANEGSFQDVGAGRGRGPHFYRDARVLAFPTPATEATPAARSPKITSSGGRVAAELLSDGRYARDVTIKPSEPGAAAWIEYKFDQPLTVQAITIAGGGGIPVGRITASDDGESYRTLVSLPGSQLYRQARVRTFAVPETSALHFRFELTGAPLRPAPTMSEEPPQPADSYSLLEWKLHPGPRIHRWEEKAGFGHLFEYDSIAGDETPAGAAIDRDAILDLTARLQPDGTLDWEAPEGNWTVLRLGYSLTGAKNRPATPAGLGYEVDKLSRKHTEAYYEAYTRPIAEALGEHFGGSLRYLLIDSWEAGQQNWTDDMIAEFTRRRGYDPTPFLPALVGRVVDSADASERFLWDFRRTLADMFADNHYAVMSERAHRDGLGVYSEAAGVSLEIPEDTLLNKSKVDIPMGEFWVRDLHPRLMYLQDVRGAASAAHAYGKPIVAAEAFTGGGYESPFTLKKVSDYWLAQGINRLVFHTSAHQPLDTKPGNTMVGTHLHRNITWAESARPLNLYFARVCHLLQQGQPVADLAYLLDEGAPSTMPIWGAGTSPAPPSGYNHDFLNADVLLHRLDVDASGQLVLPDGMSYRVLVLPQSRTMRPELLEKLHELVTKGAVIVGPKPLSSPSRDDQPAADRRVAELSASLWGDLNGTTRTINYVGRGMVVWGRPLEEVLARRDLPPDFEWSGPLDAEVAWTHRRTDDADIYYISNLNDRPVSLQTRFRVADRQPEIWRPDSGTITPVAYSRDGERTIIPLEMEQHETFFVVFSNNPATPQDESGKQQVSELAEVSGEWEVTFPPELGAPDRITLQELRAWTEDQRPGVRYFSGTATYSIHCDALDSWFRLNQRLRLDLGEVHDVAEVVVNNTSLGILWKPPYRVDVSSALHPGENHIEIRVTNQWTNRILGDRAALPDERVLSDLPPAFGRGPQEPLPSGLLGPVRILAAE